jgi:D-glycero-alpha-D-manno-heptose-7-phosphate kinase
LIITRTPYRVSLFGGGTDHAAWYSRHGSTILTSTINKYCYISARWLPPFLDYKNRIVWSKIELVDDVDDIEHPAVRAVLKYLGIEGVELHHFGDLPARSGLGSSSAFTVALLQALIGLRGDTISRKALAQGAIGVEQELLKEAVGIQDQIEVAHGGLNLLKIERSGGWHVSPVKLAPERLNLLEAHLMLFYTGQARYSSQIAKANVEAIGSGSKNPELNVLAGMAKEAVGVLAGSGSLFKIGEMLGQSWKIKRRMSELVTNPAIDDMYQKAMIAGAIGGKLLGAGGGGFMLLFVKPEDRSGVHQALGNYVEVPFAFENSGSQVIFSNSA